jgi:hypothetical protein
MNKIIFLVCVCAVLFSSCKRSSEQYDKLYFDFDSLITVQGAELLMAQSIINKKTVINGKEDRSSFTPDSLQLANELDVFRQLDLINKPLFRKMYEIKDGEKDTRSNLLIRTYTAKSPSPVPFVKFFYRIEPRELKKIESVIHEENSLYDTRRNLLMEFDNIRGTLLLSDYQLSGTQKMILNDSVHFSVNVSFSSGLQ